MNDFDEKEFYDSSDYEDYGERGADTFHALKCIEDALNLLACCGKSRAIEEITEHLNRAYQLIDRHYGEDDVRTYTFELDFNDEDDE